MEPQRYFGKITLHSRCKKIIHDSILLLWGCLPTTKSEMEEKISFSSPGDAEIYGRIYEIARSYRKITDYIEESDRYFIDVMDETLDNDSIKDLGQRKDKVGQYTQAFSEGLSDCLKPYLDTLVEVEDLVIRNQSLTISFVYSYFETYRGLLNTLNRIIKTIKLRNLVGCQIMSLVHQNLLSGDKMVHDAVLKISQSLNKVFVNQLVSWMLCGKLADEYMEFFVVDNSTKLILNEVQIKNDVSQTTSAPFDTSTELVSALQNTSLDCEFSLKPSMIPCFVPLSLAQDILFIGKTVILFGFEPRKKKLANGNTEIIFSIWEDREWEFHEKVNGLMTKQSLEDDSLRVVIKEIKECITKHLWSAAVEEAQLLNELRLMKDFFLLGRGELFLEWLRLTAHQLDQAITRNVSKDLNRALNQAAHAVFLENCEDVKRFSFEMPNARHLSQLNLTANTVNSSVDSNVVSDGWSTITLKCSIKWPLHLVFTPEVLARYNDMFRLLLRIKKTQHGLHMLWKTYKKSKNFGMCQLHNKLMFLMDNLQHYLQSDVLETNFAKLSSAAADGDFEKLRRAHAQYLADILSQSFLTISVSSDSDSSGDAMETIDNPVFSTVMELLGLCDAFCAMSAAATDTQSQEYYLTGYTERYNKLMGQLLRLLAAWRERPCGVHLAGLLVRLDYNRWLTNTLPRDV